jgi:hypothetical protein
MSDLTKWIYRISLVLLVILLIDFNSHWLRNPPGGNHHILFTNLVLAGLIIILIISKKLIRRP